MLKFTVLIVFTASLALGSGAATPKLGVHEIELRSDAQVTNPFDTDVKVTFLPPSGAQQEKTVDAFYDGDGIWRARLYASEIGRWRWTSRSANDRRLHGQEGEFSVVESKLRGRLLIHSRNPRQWMTEDGRWFLHLNDTAYFLLSGYESHGPPVSDEKSRQYVRDVVAHGITTVRCFTMIGPKGHLEDGAQFSEKWRDSIFADDALSRFRLENFQVTDRRLRWMLEAHPDLYVQFILFPRGARHGRDEQIWKRFSAEQKTRVLRYMIARFAAYPQLFWLVCNDAHYGAAFPNNNAFAREVGEYFRQHDPWQHPMSAGHARRIDFAFGGEPWATYIHLENAYDLNAAEYHKYERFAKPVFLGEDRYEHDYPERDPVDMRYFQRRLFWSWLLSGGAASYGGRWWTVVPYSQSGVTPSKSPWGANKGLTFEQGLSGLDSVKFIREYFATRHIELSDFEPDHRRVILSSAGGAADASPKAMRRGWDELLIYHPNAQANSRDAVVAAELTAALNLDLTDMPGSFAVEWYRASDGMSSAGAQLAGGRQHDVSAPWRGADVILRLTRN